MPQWKRTVPFGIAVLFSVYWLVGMWAEIIKYIIGSSVIDTAEEIIVAYVLWINFPTTFVAISYIILELRNTNDFLDGHDEGNYYHL